MATPHDSRSISCPKCGTVIDVDELLSRRIADGVKAEYDRKLEAELRKAAEKTAADQKARETKLRAGIEEENAVRLKSLQEEVERKSAKLQEFNRTQAELERVKREKNELKETLEAESERRLSDALTAEREKARKAAEEASRMKLGEKDVLIEQLMVKVQEMQRKIDQGSMQRQGEVQEIAIEDWLREAFPLDTVGEVKKGARGADCLQTVNTETRRDCGSIYYESKRTKDFQPGWIEKFKADMRAKGATMGVIVTEAMPKDMPRMGMRSGVWICSFEEFKGLSVALRESAIQLSNALLAQENRGDKMTLLYTYLTGHEFRMQIEAIVEGFVQMKADLESEKRAMEGIWKKREKQIEKVILNTTHMHGAIRGIAGAAIPAVPQLGLPGGTGNGDD